MQILSNTRTTDPRGLGLAGRRPMRPFEAVSKPVQLGRELQCPNVTIQICGGRWPRHRSISEVVSYRHAFGG